MQPTVQAIRSVSSEFAARIFLPVAITVAALVVVLLAISIWLSTLSLWWLILVFVVSVLFVFLASVLAIVGVIIKNVAPEQTKSQKKQAKVLVDKIQRLSEVTATPKFIVLFRLVKDTVVPTKNGYIASITSDSTTLQRDFNDLKNSFK